MSFVIPSPAIPSLPIVGMRERFPVRRVYCVGRNYAAHTLEMGGDPTKEVPFFFMKPADSLQVAPEAGMLDHPYPPRTGNYHFEVEMVAALAEGGRDIPASQALEHVFGYAIGLDMTRRDLQDEAKALRRPWDLAKGGDHSGPIGPIHPASRIGHPARGAISLSVDGDIRQKADLSEMVWSVADQISFLSSFVTLRPGDLVFTGTPEGVGAVVKGQTMQAAIAKLGEIRVRVV